MNVSANSEKHQKQAVVEVPEHDPATGFDYRVHIKDAKTGRMIRMQHYARHSSGGQTLLERPIGSGNAFTENGEPAGRYDFSNAASWKKLSESHVDVAAAPANREEYLTQELDAAKAEIEAMKLEHKAAQREAKAPQEPTQSQKK